MNTVTAIFRSALLGAAIAAFALQSSSVDAARIDGGEVSGWDTGQWRVQVDGVMGGKSSGNVQFLSNNKMMKFTGDISLDGGGFSSVRRRVNLDLSGSAGVVVTLEADTRGAPTGIHLQLGDQTYYDYSSAFSVPLSSEDGPVVTSVYLPIDSFDRGTRVGFQCSNCALDSSRVNNLSVYVLFQEGSFDVRLRSIETVNGPRSFPPPVYDNLESADDVVGLLRSTISSGGGLYDKSYIELCIAMYWSVLNTILSSGSGVVSESIQAVICAGLQEVEAQMEDGDSKENIAWTMRYAMDAVIADLQGSARTDVLDWLPTPTEAESMEVTCVGRTSAAQGIMYDPTNQKILVSPTNAPVTPTRAPVVPTRAPVAPTRAPVAPTEAPLAPTKAPVVPTEAPVMPTEAPIAPTVAPVVPTVAPITPTAAPILPITTETLTDDQEIEEKLPLPFITENDEGEAIVDNEKIEEAEEISLFDNENVKDEGVPLTDSEAAEGEIPLSTTAVAAVVESSASASELSSGSVSDRGLGSIVVGMLVLGVVQLGL